MDKIATPQELQAELRALMAFVHASTKPDRQVVASKLRALAARVAGVPAWPPMGGKELILDIIQDAEDTEYDDPDETIAHLRYLLENPEVREAARPLRALVNKAIRAFEDFKDYGGDAHKARRALQDLRKAAERIRTASFLNLQPDNLTDAERRIYDDLSPDARRIVNDMAWSRAQGRKYHGQLGSQKGKNELAAKRLVTYEADISDPQKDYLFPTRRLKGLMGRLAPTKTAAQSTIRIPGRGRVKVPPGIQVDWSRVNQAWIVSFVGPAGSSVLRTIADPDELHYYLTVDLR